MPEWIDVSDRLPDEKTLVTVRVKGTERPRYYRIEDRWYSLLDLDRWRMCTSPYWSIDQRWYLETEQIEGWHESE